MPANPDLHELLFFLGDDLAIEVEMPWPEFEAVQMGAATLSSLAGRTVKVAYAGVDDARVIFGLTLFHLVIDPQGQPAPFNLPLKQLMFAAGPGPDLGHGPIHLASRAQCPVPWHQRQLWHTDDVAPLRAIQQAVFHNTSGLVRGRQPVAADPVPDINGTPAAAAFEPSRHTHSTDALRIELASLRDKLRQANDEVERLRAALAHEQDRNRRLQDRLLQGR